MSYEKICSLDRAACDLDRSKLMSILQQAAQFAVIRERGEVAAFAGLRAFGRGLVIGPVVASSSQQAKDLIQFMLAHHEGDFVRLDTDLSTGLGPWLTERGLVHVGGGIPMQRGPQGGASRSTIPHICAGQPGAGLSWRLTC